MKYITSIKNKTHCSEGHALTDDNLYLVGAGKRGGIKQRYIYGCMICKQAGGKRLKTHCKQGHELSGSNVSKQKVGKYMARVL